MVAVFSGNKIEVHAYPQTVIWLHVCMEGDSVVLLYVGNVLLFVEGTQVDIDIPADYAEQYAGRVLPFVVR